MALKQHIPWPIKVAAKIVLARLPVSYTAWEKLGLFKHGDMERPEYAFKVFCTHFERARRETNLGLGFVGLELGPGDSLFSALIGKAFGASSIYLVDVDQFARRDLAPYREMAIFLREKGLAVPDLDGCQTLEEVLNRCSAHYLTAGVASLRDLPATSVDFVWSHAVLEHVRRLEFSTLFRELRRVQRESGIASHRVDLRDHLGGTLNNLRFPKPLWESAFFAKSGFYTNRIRCREMLSLIESAGFQIKVLATERWENLPTPRDRLSVPFRDVPADELMISGFDVLLS